MPTGETKICNLALSRLGSLRILDISEDSVEGRACALQYPIVRDELLRLHRWSFATRRETLTALATPPAFGWGRQYTLPEDCLRVQELNGWDDMSIPRRWEIEGRMLLTDDTVAQIKYTFRETAPSKYDALFISGFSCLLAARIAKDITGSASLGTEALTEFERILGPNARRIDAHENRKRRRPEWAESALVASRRADILSNGHDWGVFIT